MHIAEFKKQFDPHLFELLATFSDEYKKRDIDNTITGYITHVETLLTSGGKRIAPYIAYLGYTGAGGTDFTHITRIGIALEMFHIFALIHDDIVDRGMLRHGVPTLQRYIYRHYENKRHGLLEHISNGQAMLVGDIVLSWSHRILEEFPQTHSIFYSLIDDVLIGEMLDVEATTLPRVSEEYIMQKTYLKTATYKFTNPMLMGVSLVKNSPEITAWCAEFCRALGIAFQIQDDIMNIMVDPQVQHKDACNDLTERQHTLLTWFLRTTRYATKLETWWGKQIDPSEYSDVRNTFIESGAIDYAQKKMNDNFSKAYSLISSCPLTTETELTALVEYIRDRKN